MDFVSMFAYQASHPCSFQQFQQDANMCEVEFSGWLASVFLFIISFGISHTQEKTSMFNISEMYANTE